MTIAKCGDLIDHIKAAVEGHGATPHTPIFVRLGSSGPEYPIAKLQAVQDQRGFSLILEASVLIVN